MALDQPSNPSVKSSGRGRDLFFGDEPEDGAVDTASTAVETASSDVDAASSDIVPLNEAVMEDASAGGSAAVVEETTTVGETTAEVTAPIEVAEAPQATPVTRVDALPVVETDSQSLKSAPPPPPPSPPAPAAKPPSNNGGCLQSLAAMLLGALIGLGLTLAILYALNQDLRFAPRTSVEEAQRTIIALGANADALKTNVTGLQGDLSTVQDQAGQLQDSATALQDEVSKQGQAQVAQGAALDQLSGAATEMSGQITELQAETQALAGLKDQVQETQDQVAGLETTVSSVQEVLGVVASEVSTLTVRVDDLALSAQRSDRFLLGMRDLMALVYADEISPTVAITGTPPLTLTAIVTATATPTITNAVTPTVAITATPTITAAEAITVTPAVTSTPTVTTTPTVTVTVPVTAPTAAPTLTGTPVPGGGQGSIQGLVYLDGNRDSRRNPVTEAGLANVRLTLYDRNRVELDRTVTDARGNYSFGDLLPGIYVVVETDPAGYVSTSANILTVVLRSSTPASGIDFGDAKAP